MNRITAHLLVWGTTATLLSGCMGGMSGGNRQGMDHSQMQMGNATETPLAGIGAMQGMTGTQPMSGTQMAGMDHNMKTDPNKPFDAQFIDSMIVHHQGAVTMANEVLQKAEHPELKTFAEAIINAQTKEISDMQGWRKTWYPELADTGGMAMGMGDMAVNPDTSKPYDQRFLEAMISHHQGAIDMANMALQMSPEHTEIKTLAEAIIKAQQTEIAQMKAWLKEWFGVSSTLSSPYAAQVDSAVRGLSAQEVNDLLTGSGMGLARMAEMNSYPGPRHLLDRQSKLALSADQVAQINFIYDAMNTQARQLGQEIVKREAGLSTTFANKAINEAELERSVQELAVLYGQLRVTHLRAHLQTVPLLTVQQIARYDELRGYNDAQISEHTMHK